MEGLSGGGDRAPSSRPQIAAKRGPGLSPRSRSASEILRSPAMTDVARLARVSHQTVSRVLNDRPNVASLTRARVLAAIEQLGYRPNTAARTLATGHSMTLGVITLNGTFFGPVSTLYGVEQAARAAGYFLSVVSLRSIDHRSVGAAVARLTAQMVEGIAVIAPLTTAGEALDVLPADIPLVVVEGDPQGHLAAVNVDQEVGARAATAYLLSAGHRCVFHVSGPPEWHESNARLSGWRSTLQEAGIEEVPVLSGDWTARSGYEAGQVLARIPEATAIFAANDQMALGVLRALHEHGRRIPEDVSVVGFDDIPEAAYFSPPLTTVNQDFDQVGRASLKLLLDQMSSGTRSEEQVIIRSELVVRQSTLPLGRKCRKRTENLFHCDR